MKKILFTLSAIITMSLGATAQTVTDEVDIETSDVQLEIITPAEQVKETKKDIKEREKQLRERVACRRSSLSLMPLRLATSATVIMISTAIPTSCSFRMRMPSSSLPLIPLMPAPMD